MCAEVSGCGEPASLRGTGPLEEEEDGEEEKKKKKKKKKRGKGVSEEMAL